MKGEKILRKPNHCRRQGKKGLWRKSLIILFSLAILLSPFSSAGIAVFAEDDQSIDDSNKDEEVTESAGETSGADPSEEGITEEAPENEKIEIDEENPEV